jgi:hypothetical protein
MEDCRTFCPARQILPEKMNNSTWGPGVFHAADGGMRKIQMQADRRLIYDLNPISFLNSL